MSESHHSPVPKLISATMLRTKTRDILENARYGGEHFIVETFGKPMAVIMGIEDYHKLIEKQEKPGEVGD